MKYIEKLINKTPLNIPILGDEAVDEYEIYYKSLDLYYMFSKTFNLPIDLNWVMNEKIKVSDRINALLINKIKSSKYKCSECGEHLPWDYIYNMCNSCYQTNYRNSRYNNDWY